MSDVVDGASKPGVAKPVRMNPVYAPAVVEEFDHDGIADFRTHDGAQDAEPFRLRLAH